MIARIGREVGRMPIACHLLHLLQRGVRGQQLLYADVGEGHHDNVAGAVRFDADHHPLAELAMLYLVTD